MTKEINWTELKTSKVHEIEKGPCLKISADGQVVGYLVIKPEGEMANKIESLCSLIDASKGF